VVRRKIRHLRNICKNVLEASTSRGCAVDVKMLQGCFIWIISHVTTSYFQHGFSMLKHLQNVLQHFCKRFSVKHLTVDKLLQMFYIVTMALRRCISVFWRQCAAHRTLQFLRQSATTFTANVKCNKTSGLRRARRGHMKARTWLLNMHFGGTDDRAEMHAQTFFCRQLVLELKWRLWKPFVLELLAPEYDEKRQQPRQL